MLKSRASSSGFKPPLKRPLESESSENSANSQAAVVEPSKKSRPSIDKKVLAQCGRKLDAEELRERDRQLDEEIFNLRAQNFDEKQLKTYIEKLNKYNAIKDLGQMLLGQLAVRRGVTTKSLYPEYELKLDD